MRGYHVPRNYPNRLGPACTPVARHLRLGTLEPQSLATYLLVQAYAASFGLFSVTALQRFTYVDRTAQPWLPTTLMLAEVEIPSRFTLPENQSPRATLS